MAEKKQDKQKVSLLGFDPTETPEEIIDGDKNNDRKEAFKEAYKKVMQIIPDYFMTQRKKRKSSGSSGGFTQNIIVTPEVAKIETKEQEVQEPTMEREEEREK